MKKMMLLMLVLTVGCSKKLVCTYDNSTSKYSENQSITITFEEDKPTKMSTTLTFKSDDKNTFNTLKENVLKAKENLPDIMDSTIKENEDSISLTFSSELVENDKVISGTNDYENIKKYFQENGYTCK